MDHDGMYREGYICTWHIHLITFIKMRTTTTKDHKLAIIIPVTCILVTSGVNKSDMVHHPFTSWSHTLNNGTHVINLTYMYYSKTSRHSSMGTTHLTIFRGKGATRRGCVWSSHSALTLTCINFKHFLRQFFSFWLYAGDQVTSLWMYGDMVHWLQYCHVCHCVSTYDGGHTQIQEFFCVNYFSSVLF